MAARTGRALVVALVLVSGCSRTSPRAMVRNNDAAAREILAVGEGGSDTWDAAVTLVMLSRFDLDRSATIDTPREVLAVDCGTWHALETSLTAGGRFSQLRRIYGFSEGFIWVGGAIGFSAGVRTLADTAMAQCGLSAPPRSDGTDQLLQALEAARDPLLASLLDIDAAPGSEPWDAAARVALLGAYDLDGSGDLDTMEAAGVSCDALAAIAAVQPEWAALYGVDPSFIWDGGALGFRADARDALSARVTDCSAE